MGNHHLHRDCTSEPKKDREKKKRKAAAVAPEGIVAALKEKFRVEKISVDNEEDGFDAADYGCGKVKIKKFERDERLVGESLPPVLNMVLKRFQVHQVSGHNGEMEFVQQKVNDHCKVETRLDLAPFVSGKKMNCEYELFAVLMHRGTHQSGHYWSYVRTMVTADSPGEGAAAPAPVLAAADGEETAETQWLKFNDDRINRVDEEEVLRQASGVGDTSAYILWYGRADKIGEILKPPSADDSHMMIRAGDMETKPPPLRRSSRVSAGAGGELDDMLEDVLSAV